MRYIQFAVVRDSRYRSTDGFEIYGNDGTNEIDWMHPVTQRRVLFWDDALVMVPHLEGGHAFGFHLDSAMRDGHLYGTHLLDQQAWPAGTVVYELGPFVFGRFQHSVVTADEVGNWGYIGMNIYNTLVNSDPMPARDFRVASYDTANGIATFSFTPSDKLAG